MSNEDYKMFYARILQDYTQDVALSNHNSIEETLPLARQQLQELLPKGRQTEKHFFYCMLNEKNQRVGELWFAVLDMKGRDKVFIFDIFVDPESREKGCGTQMLLWLEEKTQEMHLSEIALHVFGHNPRAQKLYASLGYKTTSVQMVKKLS